MFLPMQPQPRNCFLWDCFSSSYSPESLQLRRCSTLLYLSKLFPLERIFKTSFSIPYLTVYLSNCFPSFSVSKYIFLPPGRLNAHFCPSACAMHSSVYRGSPHSLTNSVILMVFRGNCITPPPLQQRPSCCLAGV